jgi:hypothetical protein
MSNDVEVYVAVGERDVLAGRLYPHRRRGVESASFVYNDRYFADPDAYALDPRLPPTGSLRSGLSRPGHHRMWLQQILVTAADRVPYRFGVADTTRLPIAGG